MGEKALTAHAVLKQYFGYSSFREGQETLINDILSGKDVLGIMPTGAGKSICFQIPALMMEGLTVIVSPLISLMKDQVNALIQSGAAAAFINSSLTEKELRQTLDNARGNKYKLIYAAPERLMANDFLFLAKSVNISMLTIDEAHCVSQWGHDFRPSYTKIPEFIKRLPNRPIVSAFTATATPNVRDDIIGLLRLRDPTVLGTGFDRPNLRFEIQKPKNKFSALLAFLEGKKGRGGIVYCATRATVEEVCDGLKQNGYSASRYHAGLSDSERRDNQDDFLYDRARIMVATNAFGMGIDKSNVSFVTHYNMPKDIESYYQEAGRAGRDGGQADCVLLFSGQDVRTNMWLIENSIDSKELGGELSKELVLERDRAKLREMTFYCSTSDCLRGYILKYFGENPQVYCGNCGNCGTSFETVDISITAQKILSCVARMKERYGLNTIIDTLRGSKSEKIRRWGLDRLSTYGICDQSSQQLHAIMQHLLLSRHLVKTDDKFPVIKLGALSNEILRGEVAISMKLPKEKTTPKPEKQAAAGQIDKQLLDALRDLRRLIAEEQKLPAFVIFHDSTLTDMCLKLPETQEALLKVSGVGQVKAERYGKQFLGAIADFLKNGGGSDETRGAARFDLKPSAVETTDDPVTVSVIADRINCALLEGGYRKISGKRINDWLVANGFLIALAGDGKSYKVPTSQGETLGIASEERKIRGEYVKVNYFSRQAQEYIVTNFLDGSKANGN